MQECFYFETGTRNVGNIYVCDNNFREFLRMKTLVLICWRTKTLDFCSGLIHMSDPENVLYCLHLKGKFQIKSRPYEVHVWKQPVSHLFSRSYGGNKNLSISYTQKTIFLKIASRWLHSPHPLPFTGSKRGFIQTKGRLRMSVPWFLFLSILSLHWLMVEYDAY